MDMKNALSIDFEDWFQPFAHRSVPGWQQYPSRVPQDTDRLLTLFERHGVRCTFFVLGEVAEKFPECILAIHQAGHEIASHSHRHLQLFRQERKQFEAEMRRSLAFLQDLIGGPVLGFRAPFFSLREDSRWAVDSLKDLGFEYDSSMHATAGVFHGARLKGIDGRTPFTHDNGLREFPITTFPLLGMALPFGGGVYYRLLPYWIIRAGLRRINSGRMAAHIYFHPRDLDPDLPRLRAGMALRLIVHAGTVTLEAKLDRLLQDFEFCAMRDLL